MELATLDAEKNCQYGSRGKNTWRKIERAYVDLVSHRRLLSVAEKDKRGKRYRTAVF